MKQKQEIPEKNGYQIKLANWEGPLDLLLDLIRSEKLDIHNISVEKITADYLEMLHLMREMNMQISADFLVMAATLLLMKTHTLLPDEEPLMDVDQKEHVKKEALINQLLNYEKYRLASDKLASLLDKPSIETLRPLDSKPLPLPLGNVALDGLASKEVEWQPASLVDLMQAFYKLLDKQKFKYNNKLEISDINIEQEIEFSLEFITRSIKNQPGKPIALLFLVKQNLKHRKEAAEKAGGDKKTSVKTASLLSFKAQLLISFMAVLELYKRNFIELSQKKNFSAIFLQSYLDA